MNGTEWDVNLYFLTYLCTNLFTYLQRSRTCRSAESNRPVGVLADGHSVDSDVTVNAERYEADDDERQHVVADKKCDEDVTCCHQAYRETDVPPVGALLHQRRAIRRQNWSVNYRHSDPDGSDCQQDVTSSSQPAQSSSMPPCVTSVSKKH